jgi:transcriptional/translational regulatory protein YebC/TACO1
MCNMQMAESGSVLFNFERRGEIALHGLGEDAAFELALEAHGTDVEPYNDNDGNLCGYKVICTVEDYGKARDALSAMDVQVRLGSSCWSVGASK